MTKSPIYIKLAKVMVWLIFIFGLLPPERIEIIDTPSDAGGSVTIRWAPSPSESLPEFLGYQIWRSSSEAGPYVEVGYVKKGMGEYQDQGLNDGDPYYYQIVAVSKIDTTRSAIFGPVRSYAQWFNANRVNVLLFTFLISLFVLLYIRRARQEKLFIRKIPGLDAIDDAVGRSTEMGRPILYSFGLGYLSDVVTIASLSILSRVAKRAAEYGTRIIVPNYDPLVMTAAQETVKQSFTEAGRPDLFNEGDITFLTQDQFGYAAGVDGIIVREKPGTCFWQGYFFAESLILAETGHSVGAIQIAGTIAVTQLPFFIAACDYILIGEEMYAASAYLRPEPQMVGSLKGEDIAKALIIGLILLSAIWGTVGVISEHWFGSSGLINSFNNFVNWFQVGG
ncbi:MAG TPA: fibronectin type III domain-containing protein [bacterium (Candidatus Stahlbacteria)]|nr:fibronectin type III domain-containing protein [Candidatus Stahlbacteria bacterium]